MNKTEVNKKAGMNNIPINIADRSAKIEAMFVDLTKKCEALNQLQEEFDQGKSILEDDLKKVRKDFKEAVNNYNGEVNGFRWDLCLNEPEPVVALAKNPQVELARLGTKDGKTVLSKRSERSSLYGMMLYAISCNFNYCFEQDGQDLKSLLNHMLYNRLIASIAYKLETNQFVSRKDVCYLTTYQNGILELKKAREKDAINDNGDFIPDPISKKTLMGFLKKCVKSVSPELNVRKKDLEYVQMAVTSFNARNPKGGIMFCSDFVFDDIFLTLVMNLISGEDYEIELSESL